MDEVGNHILRVIEHLYFQNDNKPIGVNFIYKNLRGMDEKTILKELKKLEVNSLIFLDRVKMTIKPNGEGK
jgi:hypothetical protein